VLEALVTYRNGVFGHGAGRRASFFERMRLLLLPAVNDMLVADTLSPLGPSGTRLVYITEVRWTLYCGVFCVQTRHGYRYHHQCPYCEGLQVETLINL
jgi:hypothetical protein